MGIHREVKAIFLDRDGVINKAVVIEGKPYPPASIQELEIIEGVSEALEVLKQLGFILIIVTNQPDVARGTINIREVTQIHDYIKTVLPIDDVFCCTHDNKDECECRKPMPGMIISAARKWNINLAKSYMVGDRWRDIEAGKKAGVKTFLINYGYDEKYVAPDFVCSNLLNVTNIINRLLTNNHMHYEPTN